jgi:hypothetical protein
MLWGWMPWRGWRFIRGLWKLRRQKRSDFVRYPPFAKSAKDWAPDLCLIFTLFGFSCCRGCRLWRSSLCGPEPSDPAGR